MVPYWNYTAKAYIRHIECVDSVVAVVQIQIHPPLIQYLSGLRADLFPLY